MRSLALVLAASAITALAGSTSQSAGGAFSLAGTVVNRLTGAPVRYARVSLYPAGQHQQVETDAAGGFKFSHLEPGSYNVSAVKVGFEQAGESVELDASQENLVIRLTPLSSLRGKVIDQEGEPVEGVVVVALRSEVEGGWRRNVVAGNAKTDDRGQYRIGQLSAGRYLVQAAGHHELSPYLGDDAPAPKTRDTFAPVYFGGSRDQASATWVPVQPGADARADMALTLQPGRRIRGRIANLKPYTQAVLQLLRGQEDLGLNHCSLQLATGDFEVHDVLDGSYRLRVLGVGNEGQPLIGEQNVQVAGRDVEGVSLTLGPGVPVKATVRIEGPADESLTQALAGFVLRLDAGDELRALGLHHFQSDAAVDGVFGIEAAIPGEYHAEFEVEGPLYISSARAGNTDLLAAPKFVVSSVASPQIEVVLRADGGSIEGRIAPELEPDDGIWVLLVPESGSRPVEVIGAEEDGTFYFPAVAPGSYRLHAWKDSIEVAYNEPQVLRTLAASGTRVQVRASTETKVQLQTLSEVPQ